MMKNNTIPKHGQSAIVRNRPAIIREVTPAQTVEQELVHGVQLEYIDGITHPAEEYVIWELEVRTELLSGVKIPDPNKIAAIDHPELFQAFVNSYRWSSLNRVDDLLSDNNAARIISPWLSAVQIEDYQLYPVWKALMMPHITMLLADDVGLGKTIEAGLIRQRLEILGISVVEISTSTLNDPEGLKLKLAETAARLKRKDLREKYL